MFNREEIAEEIRDNKRLRKVVRSLLKEFVANKLIEYKKESIKNKVLNIILEAKVANKQPHNNTGINVLADLLKNIIPTVEESYKDLTSSKEQRESFRAHILNAVENSIEPTELRIRAPEDDPGKAMDSMKNIEEDLDIDLEDDSESKFIPARDVDEEPEEKETKEDSFKPLAGFNPTGRNFANVTFNNIENQILNAYESLGDSEDREVFKDYLITNLKLYFDRFEEELQGDVEEPESPDYNSV